MLKQFYKLFFIYTLTGLATTIAVAQDIEVQGYFLSDSIKVGEIKAYSLSATYPKNRQLLFPDSAFNFAPYEMVRKEWFPTHSDSLWSRDSAVYYLRTFEIDSVQHLKMPVFEAIQGELFPRYAPDDSMIFQSVIKQLPDSVILEEDLGFVPVEQSPNYLYRVLGLALALIVLISLIIWLGPKMIRAYRVYRLKSKHQRFNRQFEKLIATVRKQPQPSDAEKGLLFWKQYMDNLLQKPYVSSSTKEIVGMEQDAVLSESLKAIDRSVYGGFQDQELYKRLEELKAFAHQKFEKKKEEIKHV